MIDLKPLEQIYGYTPTFHDAIVEGWSLDADPLEGNRLTLMMRYQDVPKDGGELVCTHFQMHLRGVTAAHIGSDLTDVYRCTLAEMGETCRAAFTDNDSGQEFWVECRSIRVDELAVSR